MQIVAVVEPGFSGSWTKFQRGKYTAKPDYKPQLLSAIFRERITINRLEMLLK